MRVFQPGIRVKVCLGHVFRAKCLVLQLAKPANLLQETIQIFRQHFDDNLATQFSICLFLGTCRRDVSMFFVRKCSDLLHRVIKAADLKLDSRVANQFAIAHLRGRCFCRLGCGLFSSRNI